MAGNGLGFQNAAYAGNDKPASASSAGDRGDVDYAHDPASSGFFGSSDKKYDDIKGMLDSSDEPKKLEAMKRIIGMVAKGREASDMFPAVVKNVASKNIELKKLVYVYLTRYAEEQQDLALLSISTFQRSMKDPNQLIRASALRVLSSIRVPVIVPIMMLAIKDGVSDMSPYVRKAAAHAIPKLYSVDADQKEELVQLLEKLLGDKTTLVAGSAIQAFEEVCPERIDLIHKNYRKLCNMLVDVEEWGQVVIVNMLTRYARSQFTDPNQETVGGGEEQKEFFSDESDDDGKVKSDDPAKKPYMMDPDHRLLLRSAKPLLSSRNAAVVLAVAQLYYHCAPRAEVALVAKALTRLLRSHREVQFIVLSSIVSMSLDRKGLFEPHLKSFFIRANDASHIKLLKLDILTNIATESSVTVILREFQTYVMSPDKEFAAATIHSIGRIASSIADITDACLGGLVHLLSNRDETVVGESIVVIKKLLQMRPTEHKEIIVHLAKLAEKVTVPNARASILWLLGEYSDRVPKIAPDVLRKMAKSFVTEDDIVKLQILNLAAKLCLTNFKQTHLLCQYVFALAKYDLSYDIRDRARFLKALILPSTSADGTTTSSGALAKVAKKIFLAEKPAPVLDSKYKGREPYQLGSLSHIIDLRAHGYQALPDWPAVAPDPSVRNVELPPLFSLTEGSAEKKKKVAAGDKKKKISSFYSAGEESEEEEEESEGDDDEEKEDDDKEEEDEESGSEESSSEDSDEDEDESSSAADDDDDEKDDKKLSKKMNGNRADEAAKKSEDESSDDSSGSDDTSNDSSDDSSDEEEKQPKAKPKATTKAAVVTAAPPKKDSQLLLDFLDFGPSTGSPASTVTGSGSSSMLMPSLSSDLSKLKLGTAAAGGGLVPLPVYVPSQSYELLNRMTSNGLSVSYKFTRSLSAVASKMIMVELTFQNAGDTSIANIRMGQKRLQPNMSLQEFPPISLLTAKATCAVSMGIDFNDTLQPAAFDIIAQDRQYGVSIQTPVGELLQPVTMTENDFKLKQAKLGGMNENSANSQVTGGEVADMAHAICSRLCQAANVLQVLCTATGTYMFAGKTASSGSDVLVKITVKDAATSSVRVTVNCEKMVITSMLLKDVCQALAGSVVGAAK